MTFGYLKKFEAMGGRAIRVPGGHWVLLYAAGWTDGHGEMRWESVNDEALLDVLKAAISFIERVARDAQLIRTVEEK